MVSFNDWYVYSSLVSISEERGGAFECLIRTFIYFQERDEWIVEDYGDINFQTVKEGHLEDAKHGTAKRADLVGQANRVSTFVEASV